MFGPLPSDTHAVVLSASSEDDLKKLEVRAQQRGLKFCAIREPDPPFNGALMAIGFLPGPRSAFKSLLGRYQLLKSQTKEDQK